jgi:hypothetical protein
VDAKPYNNGKKRDADNLKEGRGEKKKHGGACKQMLFA